MRKRRKQAQLVPNPLPEGPFFAARHYAGSRSGYAFKTSGCGTGYHKEGMLPTCSMVTRTVETCKRKLPTVISLAALVLPPARQGAAALTKGWNSQLWPTTPPPQNTAQADPTLGEQQPKKATRKRRAPRKAKSGFDSPLEDVVDCSDKEWLKRGLWAVDCFNPNSWNSADAFLCSSTADFAAMQETRLPEAADCRAAEAAAARKGWSASINPAVRTPDGGASAGVAVLARKGNGIAFPTIAAVDPPDRPRISAMWVAGIQKGGVHIVSVYLWTGEGLSDRNVALLQRLELLLRTLRGPWLLCGDWNIDAEDFQRSGWPARLKGQLFAPRLPTCNDRCYDFFIASRTLAPAILGVQAIRDVGGRPHRASRLIVAGRAPRTQIRKLVRPRTIPSNLPPPRPWGPPTTPKSVPSDPEPMRSKRP